MLGIDLKVSRQSYDNRINIVDLNNKCINWNFSPKSCSFFVPPSVLETSSPLCQKLSTKDIPWNKWMIVLGIFWVCPPNITLPTSLRHTMRMLCCYSHSISFKQNNWRTLEKESKITEDFKGKSISDKEQVSLVVGYLMWTVICY